MFFMKNLLLMLAFLCTIGSYAQMPPINFPLCSTFIVYQCDSNGNLTSKPVYDLEICAFKNGTTHEQKLKIVQDSYCSTEPVILPEGVTIKKWYAISL